MKHISALQSEPPNWSRRTPARNEPLFSITRKMEDRKAKRAGVATKLFDTSNVFNEVKSTGIEVAPRVQVPCMACWPSSCNSRDRAKRQFLAPVKLITSSGVQSRKEKKVNDSETGRNTGKKANKQLCGENFRRGRRRRTQGRRWNPQPRRAPGSQCTCHRGSPSVTANLCIQHRGGFAPESRSAEGRMDL
ncbi:hypothetical protein NDU88_004478 [Pleurodeles waltl]|uniref:Uncharacterized protein n=1 Tax=Pleurodeles waltl TaxID=8319 RepID=A0AAV7PL32_PLEWA|nr:hypothetical protein NDU88_004478 [Pleurodeles waltl]